MVARSRQRHRSNPQGQMPPPASGKACANNGVEASWLGIPIRGLSGSADHFTCTDQQPARAATRAESGPGAHARAARAGQAVAPGLPSRAARRSSWPGAQQHLAGQRRELGQRHGRVRGPRCPRLGRSDGDGRTIDPSDGRRGSGRAMARPEIPPAATSTAGRRVLAHRGAAIEGATVAWGLIWWPTHAIPLATLVRPAYHGWAPLGACSGPRRGDACGGNGSPRRSMRGMCPQG